MGGVVKSLCRLNEEIRSRIVSHYSRIIYEIFYMMFDRSERDYVEK